MQFTNFIAHKLNRGSPRNDKHFNGKFNSFDHLKNISTKNNQESDYKIDLQKDDKGQYNPETIVTSIKAKTAMVERILAQTEDPNTFDSIVKKLEVMAADITQKVKDSKVYNQIHELGEKVDEIRKQKLKEWSKTADELLKKFTGNLNEIFSEQNKDEIQDTTEVLLNKEELKKVGEQTENFPTPPENHVILDKKESYADLNNQDPIPQTEEFKIGCQVKAMMNRLNCITMRMSNMQNQGQLDDISRNSLNTQKNSLRVSLKMYQNRLAQLKINRNIITPA